MNKSQRYSLIDAIRGIAVVNMVVYHLCYDIFCAFGVWSSFYRAVPVIIWERLICSTFIIISGISLHFTRHGFRRGLIVSLCGIVTTVVTVIFTPDQSIFFGVLSFLGCAMLLTYALRKLLSRMNPYVGAILFFLLFALCYNIPNGTLGFFSAPLVHLPDALYQFKWLAFLGFPSNDFFSAVDLPLPVRLSALAYHHTKKPRAAFFWQNSRPRFHRQTQPDHLHGSPADPLRHMLSVLRGLIISLPKKVIPILVRMTLILSFFMKHLPVPCQ